MIVKCIADPRGDFPVEEDIDEQSWKDSAFLTVGENYVVVSILFIEGNVWFAVLEDRFPNIPVTHPASCFQVLVNQLSEFHYLGDTRSVAGVVPFISYEYYSQIDIYDNLVDESGRSPFWKLHIEKSRQLYTHYQLRYPELLKPFEERWPDFAKKD